MSSRTSKWNRKPGDKNFELGFNKHQREIVRDAHKAKKMKQKETRKALGL